MNGSDGPHANDTGTAEVHDPALASPGQEPASQMPSSAAPATLPEPIPHAGLRYAALRLLVLAAVGAILYVAGMRGWLLAFAAVLVSGVVSLFLFMRQRNDAAVNLEHTMDHWKHRHDNGEAQPQ